MRFQKQLVQHNPDEGRWGDCFRTCIAILLNMDAADVPHFVQMAQEADPKGTKLSCASLARTWLATKGYVMLSVAIKAEEPYTEELVQELTAGMPYILTCKSPRFKDACHCVIAKNLNVLWCPVVGEPDAAERSKLTPWYEESTGAGPFWSLDVIVKPI